MVKGKHSEVRPLTQDPSQLLSSTQPCTELVPGPRGGRTLKDQVVFANLEVLIHGSASFLLSFPGLHSLYLYLKGPVCVPRASVPARDRG